MNSLKRRRSDNADSHSLTSYVPVAASRKSQQPPPFITSLWDMVESDECNEFIGWTEDGLCFQVLDPGQFQELLLPRYFKHRKFTSFIRQLNMYKFKRVATDSGSWVWRHNKFRRDHPELLMEIRRRTADHSSTLPQSIIKHDLDCDRRLEERVRELENSRSQLLQELHVGHLCQVRMRKQIETLQSQVDSILSVLLIQTQSSGGNSTSQKFGQKLLLNSSMLSQIEEVSQPVSPDETLSDTQMPDGSLASVESPSGIDFSNSLKCVSSSKPTQQSLLHEDDDPFSLNYSADFNSAELPHPNFTPSDLNDPDLTQSDLNGPELTQSDLRDPDLTHSDLNGPGLSHSDLSGPDITQPHLSESDNRPDMSPPDLNPSHSVTTSLRSSDLVLPFNDAQPTVSEPSPLDSPLPLASPINALSLQLPALNISESMWPENGSAQENSDGTELPSLGSSKQPWIESVAASNKIQSLCVRDDNQILIKNVQKVVHKLLQNLASVFRAQGCADILPNLYNGFGCWFVNTTRHSSCTSVETPPDDSDPWALLLFGVSENK